MDHILIKQTVKFAKKFQYEYTKDALQYEYTTEYTQS